MGDDKDCSKKAATVNRAEKRARRPCKSKRARFHLEIKRLCKEVEGNPIGFKFGTVTLAPSIAADPEAVGKLNARISAFREEVLRRSNHKQLQGWGMEEVKVKIDFKFIQIA